MISWQTSMQHSPLRCNFCQRNRNEQSPNSLAGSRPTVQGMDLKPQPLEVISSVMLPLARISTLVLPKHWSMDQRQPMIKLSWAPREMRRIRTMQRFLIQLNVFHLQDYPLFPTFDLFLILMPFLFVKKKN